ncbi:MAG: VOC family protein [Pseudomonadota bacterium]|nr:VOC family protein [Pseudomonadota bacterium]
MQTNRITLLVNDIDRAITFYTDVFGLTLVEDTQISATKRIVLVAPSAEGMTLSLAKPKSGDEALVGRQAGQRVFVFIDTENLETDLTRFAEKQVEIMDGPRTESFGRCVLVKDLVGNTWEFVERNQKRKGGPKVA